MRCQYHSYKYYRWLCFTQKLEENDFGEKSRVNKRKAIIRNGEVSVRAQVLPYLPLKHEVHCGVSEGTAGWSG